MDVLRLEGARLVTPMLLIVRRSPLLRTQGDIHHRKSLALELADMTLAPIHNAATSSS